MKLRPACFSQIPAFILLGSLLTASVAVMGSDYDDEENDQEQWYEMNDPYGSLRASQSMYDEMEDYDDEEDWEGQEDGYEDDSLFGEEEDDDY